METGPNHTARKRHGRRKGCIALCHPSSWATPKTAATVELYIRALAYAHKLHTGINPISEMFRAKLLLQGARRDEGPPRRNLPVPCEGFSEMHRNIAPGCLGEKIIFCIILSGWYLVLRKSEYLGPGLKGHNTNTFRHSIRAMDLEAYKDQARAEWGQPCDSVTLHIHGSKTDWRNRGTVRSHGSLPDDRPNLHLCLIRNLVSLNAILPKRCSENAHWPFARLADDELITDRQVTLVIKRAAARNGLNPELYSLHSSRAGGATALFRATGDLDLVGRFGRWKGRIIHAYLWESHVMLQGVSSVMTQRDEPLAHLAAGGIKELHEDKPTLWA